MIVAVDQRQRPDWQPTHAGMHGYCSSAVLQCTWSAGEYFSPVAWAGMAESELKHCSELWGLMLSIGATQTP